MEAFISTFHKKLFKSLKISDKNYKLAIFITLIVLALNDPDNTNLII